MEREDFVKQYVLNRASCHRGGLDGQLAMKEAYKAWDSMKQEEKYRYEHLTTNIMHT